MTALPAVGSLSTRVSATFEYRRFPADATTEYKARDHKTM
jgi:hypothetical protein